MGRIKKAAGPKHEATVSPAIAEFVATATSISLPHLPTHLNSFPRQWPFPRGDLYHWIPLFNRFDSILEQFNVEYGLNIGPQTQPFARVLLEKGVVDETKAAGNTKPCQDYLDSLGFSTDGDRQLVENILVFSRVLLENCGNRSLYNSSDRLGDILNTTDLSLLSSTLHLAVRLAQRYHASRQRGTNASQHLNNALLASHYNIDLEKVQKLANPFVKSRTLSTSDNSQIQELTPVGKGKEKAETGQPSSTSSAHASDLLTMATDDTSRPNAPNNKAKALAGGSHDKSQWEMWGGVSLRYYQRPIALKEDLKMNPPNAAAVSSSPPNTPTPMRRTSGLSRQSRLPISDDATDTSTVVPSLKPDETLTGGMKSLEIPFSKVSSTSMEEILKVTLPDLPKDSHYDLLTRVRVAHALTDSLTTRQKMVGVRLLAITNLAYIYPEATFQQKILHQDSDEPRRLQLAYQLADIIHSPGNGRAGIPVELQTLALGTIEALAKHKAKAADVCAALNINVNHGVLFYVLRKAVADMETEDAEDDGSENNEWREALFSLLDTLPGSSPRTGEILIAAGLLDILIEILNLRTSKAERSHPRVLAFLNSTIYTVRDAFQTLANSKGLDTISDLIAYEVKSSLECANNGDGLPQGFRNQVIDYQVPYFQQQTLRWLFKFVNHMMSHGSGNFDRFLRNLIDSPQLLSGLRTVIVNAKVFGSSVWSGAVNIMSSFIHNEPTSYAVIAEAGLSRGLLEAITGNPITDPAASKPNDSPEDGIAPSQPAIGGDDNGLGPVTLRAAMSQSFTPEELQTRFVRSEQKLLAQGILPASDSIVTIPQALGAICLNNSGLELFLNSGALDSFFEIFESPDHVKSMNLEGELARLLGNSFDELVRHHPRLKTPVMNSVMAMVGRVGYLCKARAFEKGFGAKLWTTGENGQLEIPEDGTSTLDPRDLHQSRGNVNGIPPQEGDNDVVMSEAISDGAPYSSTVPISIMKSEGALDAEEETNGPSTSTYINVAMKFLVGFFENSALCSSFVEMSGVEFVLDFATLSSLQYDFNNQAASQEIARVVHMLAEQKPHLVLPSLVKRTQKEVDLLDPLSNHSDGTAFFKRFTSTDRNASNVPWHSSIDHSQLVKSMIYVHTLCNVLSEAFSPPIYNSRSSHTVFSQVNLADMYITLVKSLGRLHRACVWEEILLQKSIPDTWKEATRVKGYGMGSEEADKIFGFINHNEQPPETTSTTNDLTSSSSDSHGQPPTDTDSIATKKPRKPSVIKEEKTAQFKNVRTLRYLLSQIPTSIIPFFQGLGKALIAKRRPEGYARQNAYMVAEAMAEANLEQLEFEAPKNAASAKDRYAYWIVILTSISQLMIEGPIDRPHPQCLTLVLQAFKNRGGLDTIKHLLNIFSEEVKNFTNETSDAAGLSDGAARLTSAYGGIKIILNFYTQITSSKCILDASQTVAIALTDRDRPHPHFFSPPQFLVELRMAVLPEVKSIWDSEFVDKASSPIIKSLIEILRIILDAGEEQGGFKRGEKLPARSKAPFKPYPIHSDKITNLTDKGYDIEAAREALYRCMNVQNAAEEYCRAQKAFSCAPRNPIPSYDLERPKSPAPLQTPQRQDSQATIPDSEHAARTDDSSMAADTSTDEQLLIREEPLIEIEEPDRENHAATSVPLPPLAPGVPVQADASASNEAMNSDDLVNEMLLGGDVAAVLGQSSPERPSPSSSQVNITEGSKLPKPVTIEDLDEVRSSIRRNLIDRALDVLNIHDEVTFELADLINAAALKATDAATMRREIGETLVQSLISFQMDEDFRPAGKKIAAYANLLALVIQDRDFYEATLDELKSNFESLRGFVKIFPDQAAEGASPWVGQILLIIEKILAEDVQPSQIQWSPPSIDSARPDSPIVAMDDPLIPSSEKMRLFEAMVDILPRIGKDESLALSVVRTMVILSRNREIADKLGEKKTIQRFFIMIKQLAGITNDRLQSSFMLLLRHIVEDDDTIRQIMRSEIMANFDPRRGSDTTGYVRQMFHLVLRSPEIFIEVTNEKLEIKEYNAAQRPQTLVLKPEKTEAAPTQPASVTTNDATGDGPKVLEGQPEEEVEPVPPGDSKVAAQKPRASEAKAPVVEKPSGVIWFLLQELLSYKDVEDKDQASSTKESIGDLTTGSSTQQNPMVVNSSISSAQTSSSNASVHVENGETKKAEKPEFKTEQHPIYVYRCFILQCLTELLHSYNRTKIEFINFSRKAEPKATTPSKPRSGVLNYLLNDLVPVGTLSHDESIPFRKKSSTSNWAMSVIVALCLRTNENGYDKKQGSLDEEDESDLLFVRKFVLEHALKAYRDCSTSNEALDVKYARLLSLADLFNRILLGKLVQSVPSHPPEMPTQKLLAKIMFEKSFLSALTGSIADIDLNFPGSKRAVKYILRPLKQLTQTAIVLSETSDISSTPGQTDDDEISTASSVSEMDDEREETPDLFRNSTLGMFEPGREEESSSESSDGDGEMFDDEYEEDMEYEEEIERDGDEVISDEEEEIEVAGPMEGMPGDTAMDVEVVIDGDDEEPSDDDDDPDDSDDMDDGDDIEVIDEITGDSLNDSLADGEVEGWEDEDDEEGEGYNGEGDDLERDLSQGQDPESAVRDMVRELGVEAGLRRLEGPDLSMDIDGDGYMDDVVRDDEDAEDEEEDDGDDEDVIYEPEYDDEESGMPDPPWGWGPDDEQGMGLPRGHHHHHHSRRVASPWTIFPGGPSDRIPPMYRPHRPSGAPRAADDGVNPLLQRSDRLSGPGGPRLGTGPRALSEAVASMSDYWVHGMEPGPRGISSADNPVSFVNNIIAAIGQGGSGFATMGGPHGAMHIHVPGGGRGLIPRELQAVLGLRHAPQDAVRTTRDENMQPTSFVPASTPHRWQEEARLLFGNAHSEKALRVIHTLLKILVPPAIEKEEREEEEAKQSKEERERKMEEERVVREKVEKEAKEKAEQEQREAAAAAAAAAPSPEEERAERDETTDEGAMEGVEPTHTDASQPASSEELQGPSSAEEPVATSSAPTERVRTTIRGRELDITGMGVDLEYLNALPEDLREEVLMSQVALQRSQAAAAGEEPTDISREFLEALPPDIREELLQQEAQDRRRREREEARRRVAASNGGSSNRGEEMDPASFLASLDPVLRQSVLMEQDEDVLAQLPQAIAAEARALGSDHRILHRLGHGYPRGIERIRALEREAQRTQAHVPTKKTQRRQIVQMLDKAGVATLLRLMFIPQQGSSRQSLNGILHDVSQNRQNRAEIVSLLLSILQDGSADVNAIERSFTHLSLRAKPPATQKTPLPLKRTSTGPIAAQNNTEMTPLMVIQQCLSALVYLTQYNPHIPSFFLTEHEVSSGLKSKMSRKGKGKESKASKYALNALLSLLDRKLIMESSSCMEQLSSLLQSVTHPLIMLLRKEREKAEEPTKASGDVAQSHDESTSPATGIDNNATQQAAQSEDAPMTDDTPPLIDVETQAHQLQVTPMPPQENPTGDANVGPDDPKASTDEEKAKKQRSLTPPIVPEENLRLVVSILAARECTAKTFRDTLSTINNLSAIPGAKEIFGKGLIEQAQDLGQSILRDLDELVLQIQQAESGTDIQGMALAKFSPASSDQAKLLRVLTALDYLFDPKRNGGKTKPSSDDQIPASDASAQNEDILTALYENSTFGPLWTKLSECLSSLSQGDGMLNIATILLPLIEALMVVCKNTTLKDAILVKPAKEFSVTSPPPESGMESLFFRFTEDHRKILNDLVRHNPKLMSGTFSLLVKNPKVLEFDNKRNYFTRRLHSRGNETRQSQPPLQLSVRRDQVFTDSVKAIYFKKAEEIKYGKLSIRFNGEEGVDAGGVTREWFQVLSRQMFNPDYCLFIPVASDRTTFHPNKQSGINDEHLMYFKFIGRIIGKALYEGRALDCHFSRAVYKRILGKTVSIKDMETLDLQFYKSLLWMLENDISDVITDSFSVETDDFGVIKIVDLIENGRNIPVTEENKHEYVQLMVEYRLIESVQEQLEHFLKGFHDIVPAELISIFNEQELELLISGLPDIDVDDWKNNTEYHNYSASSPQIQWFWRAVRSFDKEERAKLLQFVTGTSKVPLNGFGQLEGMNGFSRFNVHRDYGNKDRLPSSHTCFNQLDLPEYDSYETLRQQVYTAITAGGEYFGFA